MKAFTFGDPVSIRMALAGVLFIAYSIIYAVPLQQFAYTGLYTLDINWIFLLVNFAVTVLVAAMLPGETTAVSIFLWFVFILMLMPRMVLAACSGDPVWYCLFCVVAFMIVVAVAGRMKPLALHGRIVASHTTTTRTVTLLASVAFALLPIAILAITLGAPNLDAFNYENTYEIRGSLEFDFALAGVLATAGSRVLPALIGFALAAGFVPGAIVATIAELLLFLWTANKSWFLLIVLVWGLYALAKLRVFTLDRFIALFAVLMVAVSVIASISRDGVVLVAFSFLMRRLIFVPAALGDAYFQFFLHGNEIVWLQNTVLSFMTPMPEQYSEVGYTVQVGSFAMGRDVVTNANTGLFGGELANFGSFFGFVIIIANLLFICKLLSVEIDSNPERYFLLGTSVVLAFLLLNTSSIRLLFSPSGLIGTIITIALVFSLADIKTKGSKEVRLNS